MLQNAYLLAKIGVDTAENERNFANNWRERLVDRDARLAPRVRSGEPGGPAAAASGVVFLRPGRWGSRVGRRSAGKANFGGLVLGCIEANF